MAEVPNTAAGFASSFGQVSGSPSASVSPVLSLCCDICTAGFKIEL